MVQSGQWPADEPLTAARLRVRLAETIDAVDLAQARSEVEPFVRDPDSLALWSPPFFHDVASRILCV